ncbi:MAG: hypothetical protein AAGA09_00305 [Pseudomonadota bacterium]
MSKLLTGVLFAMAASLSLAAFAAKPDAKKRETRRASWAAIGIEDHQPNEVAALSAKPLEEFSAVEALQGAAADDAHFYAIVNYVIGKYDRKTGALVARWKGKRGGPIRHINSCFEEDGRLYCANSNHPQLPMASSIEVFETKSMAHVDSKSLGVMDEGSLVWFDRFKDGWIAGFAHYDDETGLPYKDHSYAAVVTFDAEWRRTGGYALPASILEKMAPQAASGGALGADGRLYVMGHDRPEMYVLQFPAMGPVLEHVATIAVPAEGQAFAFDRADPHRVWAISRPRQKVLSFEIPTIGIEETARR